MSAPDRYELVVIGGGPAGMQAALHGAKAGRRVLLVDRHARIGGECVLHGTIPSKTLRESAVYFAGLRQRSPDLLRDDIGPGALVRTMMRRLDSVLDAYEQTLTSDLERSGALFEQCRASFVGPHELELLHLDGSRRTVHADAVLIATGSRPRQPPDIAIDHEHVLDSDSILDLIYLPRSLGILGAGVIACEFATVFQSLGVQVTLIDKGERPLAFLDPELTDVFLQSFERAGGTFVSRARTRSVEFDGLSEVIVELEDERVSRYQKVLVTLGRTASLGSLHLERVGLETNERGFLQVDEGGRTNVMHVFAAGDVVGPPALAAWSMEQGRRAARTALGLPAPRENSTIPVGIYTIPEMASVGLTQAQAHEHHAQLRVGRAHLGELARGRINGMLDGLLKLVATQDGRLLGAHAIGEGSTELIHLAQVALLGGLDLTAFVDNVFNFPTLAEAYRVAALDALESAALRRAA